MNERIKELEKQCTIQYRDNNGGYVDTVDTDKFAEMILQECITRLRLEGNLGKIQLVAGPSGAYKLAFMNEAANIIKEHFGIE